MSLVYLGLLFRSQIGCCFTLLNVVFLGRFLIRFCVACGSSRFSIPCLLLFLSFISSQQDSGPFQFVVCQGRILLSVALMKLLIVFDLTETGLWFGPFDDLSRIMVALLLFGRRRSGSIRCILAFWARCYRFGGTTCREMLCRFVNRFFRTSSFGAIWFWLLARLGMANVATGKIVSLTSGTFPRARSSTALAFRWFFGVGELLFLQGSIAFESSSLQRFSGTSPGVFGLWVKNGAEIVC